MLFLIPSFYQQEVQLGLVTRFVPDSVRPLRAGGEEQEAGAAQRRVANHPQVSKTLKGFLVQSSASTHED